MSWPNRYEGFVAALEFIGGIAIYGGGVASHDHYTWWSLALVLVYVAAVVYAGAREASALMSANTNDKKITLHHILNTFDRGAEQMRKKLWVAPFVSAFVVVLGVITMSAIPCTLLKDLYVENGPLVYSAGNFFVHYWPLCRLVLFAPISGPLEGLKPLLFATHLILVYTLCFSPNEIYGCSALPRAITTLILLLVPMLAFVVWWFILYCELPAHVQGSVFY